MTLHDALRRVTLTDALTDEQLDDFTSIVDLTVGPDGKLASSEVVSRSGLSREHRLLDRMAESKLSE